MEIIGKNSANKVGRFGIYIHIPHCLQVCPYCDFTKYEVGKIMPPESYAKLLVQEVRDRAPDIPLKEVSTVYFGGGTPSLFEPSLILAILESLAMEGFRISQAAEITLEINPGTIDQRKLDAYRSIGINRFSVGAQTFNSRLLSIAGRKHSAAETVETLTLLKNNSVNYSFDLLFALPSQTLKELGVDLDLALSFKPSHLSAYCLTVPESHPMARGRAPESEQVEMFEMIESILAAQSLERYEISNFAAQGFESQHNLLYWSDSAFWGLGVSAHSYFPAKLLPDLKASIPWGVRFWNAPALDLYAKQLKTISSSMPPQSLGFAGRLPARQYENLKKNEALTDFCHTSLRCRAGLSKNATRLKFGDSVYSELTGRFEDLVSTGLIVDSTEAWALSKRGRLLADLVFQKLTFLAEDLKPSLSSLV